MGLMLDFDKVPNTNPMGYVTPGFYKATIKKKEVKVSDKTNKEYLMVSFDLATVDGVKAGSLSDFFRDLDTQQISLYKLGRLMQALGIANLTGNIDLRTIVQMIQVGKEVAVEVGDNTYGGKTTSQVQVMNSQCYWPVSMLPGLVAADAPLGAVQPAPKADETPVPIKAPEQEYQFNAADGRIPPAETGAATGATAAPGGDNY